LQEKIRILDTTLRDGEQTPGVVLNADDKMKIASALDELGVSVIEAGSPATSAGEREALSAVTHLGLSAEISAYCRMKDEDIDLAVSCDVDSVHLVVPSSDLHIATKMHLNIQKADDRELFFEKAASAVEYAKKCGLTVEFSCEDASRADLPFLKELYRTGIDSGADRICFCDTVGILTPERSMILFSDLSSSLKAPVSVHCHDDLGLATANTVAALRAGASQAHVSVNGIGERSGNTALEEVVMVMEHSYGCQTGIDTQKLYRISRLVSRLTGIPVAPNKAFVGENSFTHEAGIHVHDMMRNPSTYEPIQPESVGRRRKIILGKHAGLSSVELELQEYGISATDEQKHEIFRRIKELGDRGKHVTDADFRSISNTVLGLHQDAAITLKSFSAISGRPLIPTASVILDVNGKEVVEAGTGDGPVDAAISAVRKAVSSLGDVTLEEYHVDAITGGTDALVEVTVRLSRDGETVTAKGSRTDIIEASVEAVINGMNMLF